MIIEFKEAKFMREKNRYQAKTDLKMLRNIYNLSKEDVAREIGYSTRTLERIEKENAVIDEQVAKRLSSLYNIDFGQQFYIISKQCDNLIKEEFAKLGNIPKNLLIDDNIYYCIYVRKIELFIDCIAGKGVWIRKYNRNKEVRKLGSVNAKSVLEQYPDIQIINNGKEWDYWYFKLCVGKLYKVLVSEKCMKERLKNCLEEKVVKKEELMRCDGITDIMFLGDKKK